MVEQPDEPQAKVQLCPGAANVHPSDVVEIDAEAVTVVVDARVVGDVVVVGTGVKTIGVALVVLWRGIAGKEKGREYNVEQHSDSK